MEHNSTAKGNIPWYTINHAILCIKYSKCGVKVQQVNQHSAVDANIRKHPCRLLQSLYSKDCQPIPSIHRRFKNCNLLQHLELKKAHTYLGLEQKLLCIYKKNSKTYLPYPTLKMHSHLSDKHDIPLHQMYKKHRVHNLNQTVFSFLHWNCICTRMGLLLQF